MHKKACYSKNSRLGDKLNELLFSFGRGGFGLFRGFSIRDRRGHFGQRVNFNRNFGGDGGFQINAHFGFAQGFNRHSKLNGFFCNFMPQRIQGFEDVRLVYGTEYYAVAIDGFGKRQDHTGQFFGDGAGFGQFGFNAFGAAFRT